MMQTIKKHSTLFIVIGIIAVVVAAMLYVILQPQPVSTPKASDRVHQTAEEPADSVKPPTSQAPVEPPKPVPTTGVYKDYSETAFNQAEGRRIIFFHAPWCPQCRQLDASILASTVPSGVSIFKIDYDSNQSLRQKYGVVIQTTLVEVDENGNQIQTYVAYEQPTFGAVKAAMNL